MDKTMHGVRLDLSREDKARLTEHMAHGGPLARLLIENMQGRELYTFMPPGLGMPDPLSDFAMQGVDLKRDCVEHVAEFLTTGMTLVCEDVSLRPDVAEGYAVFVGTRASYHLLNSPATTDDVWMVLDGPTVSWFSIGCVTRAAVDDNVLEADLAEVLSKAPLAFVEAFDGNSYVFWNPSEEPQPGGA